MGIYDTYMNNSYSENAKQYKTLGEKKNGSDNPSYGTKIRGGKRLVVDGLH